MRFVKRHQDGIAFWLVGLLYLFFISYIMIISVPNPIKTRYSIFKMNFLHKSIPEGWGFFTKDPRSENTEIFSKSSDKKLTKINLINNQALYFFGANRSARQLNSKLGQISTQVEDENWIKISKEKSKSDIDKLDSLNIPIFYASEPCFFGDFIITKSKPVSWSWFSYTGLKEVDSVTATQVRIIKRNEL